MDDDFDERLAAAAARLAGLGPTLLAGDPWPLAERFDHAPEAAWGPREVLAHVAEMLPFWLGEAERVIDMTDGPEPFGRVATDDVRVAIIERDRTLPMRELLARTSADVDRWRRRWTELTPGERARIGIHPLRGEMRVADIAERFVSEHLDGHVDQLAEILAGTPSAG